MKKNKKQGHLKSPSAAYAVPSDNGAAIRPAGPSPLNKDLPALHLQNLIPVAFIVVLTLLVYANSLKNGFVYDDDVTIIKNTLIKDISNLPKLFVKEDYFAAMGEQSYRPLVTFTYFVDYALYGLKPWGFHLTNILLHAANGTLLYIFLTVIFRPSTNNEHKTGLLRILGDRPFLISLLFVAHPVLTEAVNAISFREDLLAFLFYMAALTLYMYLRSNSSPIRILPPGQLYRTSCLFYLFALLSKEMAATLPLIIFCYEWTNRDIKKDDLRSLLFNHYNIGYIGITLFYLYLNFYYFQNPAAEPPPSTWGGFIERILTIPWLLLTFMKLAVFPVYLSADYVFSLVKTVYSETFIMPSVLVAAFLILSILIRKWWRNASFGAIFFAIALVPVYNIIPIYNPLAERHLYLPITGFILVMGQVLIVISETQTIKPEARNIVISILLLCILTLYSLTAIRRNTVWRDGYSLWSDTTKKMPSGARAHYGLGTVYFNMGRMDDAVREYEVAIKIKQNFSEAYYNLGNVYYAIGKVDEAIQEYNKSLGLKPAYSDAHYNLGIAYVRKGMLDKAKAEFRAASRSKTDDPEPVAHNSLGITYADKGRLDEAEMEFQAAIRLRPDYSEAHSNLGSVYAGRGRFNEAMMEFQTALTMDPEEPKYHYNLGNVHHNLGQLDEAVEQYQAALNLNNNFVEAHYSLGVVYLKKGLKNKARTELESALRLRPDFPPATQVLESIP